MVKGDKSDLSVVFGRIASKASAFKARAADVASKAGYLEEAARHADSAWRIIESSGEGVPSFPETIASGYAIAASLEQTLDKLERPGLSISRSVDLAVPVFSTASATSVITCNSISTTSSVTFAPCPFLPDSDEQGYAARLEELSSALGATYRAAWSAFYSDQDDPGRTALWQMRQVFDHFFDILAPDASVRESLHWSPKEAPNEQAVHRTERLAFAAALWPRTELRAVLTESVTEAVRAYGRLNEAHKRGVLDTEKARQSFRAADALIRRWVDSIQPWPPDLRTLETASRSERTEPTS